MIKMGIAITTVLLLGIASLPAAHAEQTTQSQPAVPAVAPKAATEPEGNKQKLELDRVSAEIAKLNAETAKVQAETSNLQPWYGQLFGAVLGVVVGVVGLFVTGWFGLRTALRARLGTFDMKLY